MIWGGSTSVGSCAIQLAVAAGYEVFTTASPKNFAYVTGLGASQVFDYNGKTVVADMIRALKGKTLAPAPSPSAPRPRKPASTSCMGAPGRSSSPSPATR